MTQTVQKDLPVLLRPAEAAKHLTVSTRHLRRLVLSGHLEAVRMGRRAVRYRTCDASPTGEGPSCDDGLFCSTGETYSGPTVFTAYNDQAWAAGHLTGNVTT